MRTLTLLLALLLVSCGTRPSWYRTRHYDTSSARLAQAVERALTQLGYRYSRVGDDPPNYQVGPFWYGPGHTPIDAPVGVIPDGTERVDLWVGVGGHERIGYYPHIGGAVYRYRAGTPVYQRSPMPPDYRRSHDELAFNSKLSELADPVFVRVYTQLEGVASDPP